MLQWMQNFLYPYPQERWNYTYSFTLCCTWVPVLCGYFRESELSWVQFTVITACRAEENKSRADGHHRSTQQATGEDCWWCQEQRCLQGVSADDVKGNTALKHHLHGVNADNVMGNIALKHHLHGVNANVKGNAALKHHLQGVRVVMLRAVLPQNIACRGKCWWCQGQHCLEALPAGGKGDDVSKHCLQGLSASSAGGKCWWCWGQRCLETSPARGKGDDVKGNAVWKHRLEGVNADDVKGNSTLKHCLQGVRVMMLSQNIACRV